MYPPNSLARLFPSSEYLCIFVALAHPALQLRRQQAAGAELDGDREGGVGGANRGDRRLSRGGGDVRPFGGRGGQVGRLLPRESE